MGGHDAAAIARMVETKAGSTCRVAFRVTDFIRQ